MIPPGAHSLGVDAEHDYEVNIIAETGIEELHRKLDGLRQAQWEELLELQRRQMALLERLAASG